MRSYRLSLPAQDDFAAIGRYTQNRWGAPQRREYLGRLIASFESLMENVNLGRIRDDIRPGIRSHLVGGHVILFRRINGVVEIVRILHQRQSIDKAFSESPSR